MDFIFEMFDFLLHVDKYLVKMIEMFEEWTYLILFIVIFCETGLVITPFLPGDSLLFVIGAFSANGAFDLKIVLIILPIAGILGNTVNYLIGKLIGTKILETRKFWLINKIIKQEYIDKTQEFYNKHGGKAIFFSRFMPIFRTFAPFVSGIGRMNFVKFTIYNISGAISWIVLFLLGGYFFGNVPVIKNNLTLVILAIIIISFLPAVISAYKIRKKKSKRDKSL